MKYITFLIAACLISSCTDNKDQKTTPPAIQKDQKTMTNANEQIITTPSGLQYIERAQGTGVVAEKGKMVSVHYTGTLENGQKFDSSVDRGQPIEFKLGVGQVISGWDEGISGMKIGGKRKLIIPADLAYGSRRTGTIPANSTLLFEVELMGVK